MNFMRFDPAGRDSTEGAQRRHRLVALVLLIAGLTMADLHWRAAGYDGWKGGQLLLFVALDGLVSLGAAQA